MALTNTQVDAEIHLATDRQTLVRIVIDGEFEPLAASSKVGLLLQRCPQGNVNSVPKVASSLKATPGKDWIWHTCRLVGGGATDLVVKPIFVDLGSMRKLDKDDTLVLSGLGDNPACAIVWVTCTMFFKE